jgi:hypothetical protein
MFLQARAASLATTRRAVLKPVGARLERFGEFVEKESAQSEREDEKKESAAEQDEVFEMIAGSGRGRREQKRQTHKGILLKRSVM